MIFFFFLKIKAVVAEEEEEVVEVKWNNVTANRIYPEKRKKLFTSEIGGTLIFRQSILTVDALTVEDRITWILEGKLCGIQDMLL